MQFFLIQEPLFVCSLWICLQRASAGSLASPSHPITTTVPKTCPCSETDEYCHIEQMFGALQFWQEDANRCVTEQLFASVQPWHVPYILPSFRFVYLEECGNSGQVDLLLNNSNACGSFRCCAKCQSCVTNVYDMLEPTGTVILKSRIAFYNGYQGPAKIMIYCAPIDARTPLGYQDFYVTFETNTSCAATPAETKHNTVNNTISPLAQHQVSPTTNDDRVNLGLVISGASVLIVGVTCVGINYAVTRVYKITPSLK